MQLRVLRSDGACLRNFGFNLFPLSLRPRWPLVVAAVLVASSAVAQETTSYKYDALGRLVSAVSTGTVNDGKAHSVCYDPSGNRTLYKSASLQAIASCAGGSGGGTSPTFSISDASATEGSPLSFTVTRTGANTDVNSINYATANGTAIAGSDYTANSGTLTFNAGQATQTVNVVTIDDSLIESSETVFVNLSNATGGATINDAQGIGTIIDNDPTTAPSFSINDAAAVEGNTITFTVTKTGTTSNQYIVNYATTGGTATAGSDYTIKSGSVTFAASEMSKIITVSTIQDQISEDDETLFVNLSGAAGATFADAQGVGTINDDDLTCLMSADPMIVDEADSTTQSVPGDSTKPPEEQVLMLPPQC